MDFMSALKILKYSGDIKEIVDEKTRLMEVYEESSRHYHTLKHINEMLSLSNQFDLTNEQRAILTIAIWYHDYGMDFNSSGISNINTSCNRAITFLKNEISTIHLTRIRDLIYVTLGHQILDDRFLTKLICDLDLAILGSIEIDYKNYVVDITLEYQLLPFIYWNELRSNWLEKMLQRPRIYYTPIGLQREYMARFNMSEELRIRNTENQEFIDEVY